MSQNVSLSIAENIDESSRLANWQSVEGEKAILICGISQSGDRVRSVKLRVKPSGGRFPNESPTSLRAEWK